MEERRGERALGRGERRVAEEDRARHHVGDQVREGPRPQLEEGLVVGAGRQPRDRRARAREDVVEVRLRRAVLGGDLEVAEHLADHVLEGAREQPPDDAPHLDLARPLVEVGHAHVAHVALDPVVARVAVPAVELERAVADRVARLGGPVLRERREDLLDPQEPRLLLAPRRRARVVGPLREHAGEPAQAVHDLGRAVDEVARRLEQGLHLEELLAHGREVLDRAPELAALLHVPHRRRGRRLGDADGLRRDLEARAVDQREHVAREPPSALADEPPLGAVEGDHGGRASVDAELLLELGHLHPVRARHGEEGEAAGVVAALLRAGEHEEQVGAAVRAEDLAAVQAPEALRLVDRRRLRRDAAERGARLGLGEAHAARELARGDAGDEATARAPRSRSARASRRTPGARRGS